MRVRHLLLITVVCLCATGAALAQPEVLDLETLWRRGQFELARELIEANLASGNRTAEFLAKASRCAEEMHDYGLAADLYSDYAESLDRDTTAYRDARYHAWANLWELNEHDPGLEWVIQAKDEVDSWLESTRLKAAGADRRRALELEFLLDSLLGLAGQPGEELRTGYPDSDLVLKAAKEAADTLSTEPDHTRRLELADSFLADYPGCHWRHYVWRYKLYTCWQLRQWDQLFAAADAYLAEYPDNTLSLGAVSRYYFDADLRFDEGYDYALRSIELGEMDLGTNGSESDLEELNDATLQLPPQPDYLPPDLRGRFLNYLGSRFNLARYLVVKADYDFALEMVLPVINVSPYTTDDDLTIAPFLLIAGQAYEGLDKPTEAVVYYHAAAVAGDSRNRYALQAVEHLTALVEELGADEVAVMTGAFNDAWTNGLSVPVFTDVTEQLGLSGADGRRVAWGDVDLDGDPDLLLDGTRLYRNDLDQEITGAGFTDASRVWGLSSTRATCGVFADVDNDGDLDLYTTGSNRGGDHLWRNDYINRSGTAALRFSDITNVAGAPSDEFPSEGACWTDINCDGFIDLYVANYEQPFNREGRLGVGTPDRVYLNNGGTYFARLDADAAGLTPPFGTPHASRGAVAACDFDNDGDQDIFTGNYRLQENFLWRNNGSGAFTNAARLLGVAGHSDDGWWGHTIGVTWGDVDNDGDFDLFAANLAHPRYIYSSDKSQLLINEHGLLGPSFSDERGRWGIKYEETHACPVFLDANNDGYLDLYLTSMYDGRRSFLYVNGDPGGFRDLTWLAGARVLNGFGAAWADYDGDGDQDLAVGRVDGSVILLRNDSPADAHWLQVECVGGVEDGTGSNRSGIGALVTVITPDGLARVAEIQSGTGTGCGNQLIAHFGLGDVTGPVEVSVRFPSGRLANLRVSKVDQLIVISEADASMPAPPEDVVEPEDPEALPEDGEVVAEASDDGSEEPEDNDRDALERLTGSRGGD